jgi:hypothetical protein
MPHGALMGSCVSSSNSLDTDSARMLSYSSRQRTNLSVPSLCPLSGLSGRRRLHQLVYTVYNQVLRQCRAPAVAPRGGQQGQSKSDTAEYPQ